MENLLERAKSIVDGDRQVQYGDVHDSFKRIAGLWGAYLDMELNTYDVANMMILLKVSRAKKSQDEDSYIDIAGYVDCVDKLMRSQV